RSRSQAPLSSSAPASPSVRGSLTPGGMKSRLTNRLPTGSKTSISTAHQHGTDRSQPQHQPPSNDRRTLKKLALSALSRSLKLPLFQSNRVLSSGRVRWSGRALPDKRSRSSPHHPTP